MDFYELLKDDHKRVAGLFRKLEKPKRRKVERDELFLELKRELEIHTYLEEKIVYRELEKHHQTKDIALEAREEHRLVQVLLDEMEGIESTDEIFEAKLKVLKESIVHHVKEEEGEMFNKARKVITEKRAEEMGADMISEKALQKASAPEPISKLD